MDSRAQRVHDFLVRRQSLEPRPEMHSELAVTADAPASAHSQHGAVAPEEMPLIVVHSADDEEHASMSVCAPPQLQAPQPAVQAPPPPATMQMPGYGQQPQALPPLPPYQVPRQPTLPMQPPCVATMQAVATMSNVPMPPSVIQPDMMSLAALGGTYPALPPPVLWPPQLLAAMQQQQLQHHQHNEHLQQQWQQQQSQQLQQWQRQSEHLHQWQQQQQQHEQQMQQLQQWQQGQQQALMALMPNMLPSAARDGGGWDSHFLTPNTTAVRMGAPSEQVQTLTAINSGSVPSPTGPSTEKVKALVQSGGGFTRTSAGVVEYTGGETRLVTVPPIGALRAAAQGPHRALIAHLSGPCRPMEAASLEDCTIRYELPGSRPPIYIDLMGDDDVVNMWEAWQEHCAVMQAAAGGTSVTVPQKLRICIEQALPHHEQAAQAAAAGPVAAAAGDSHSRSSSSVGDSSTAWARAALAAMPASDAPRQPDNPFQAGGNTPRAPVPASDNTVNPSSQSKWAVGIGSNPRELVSTTPRVGLADLEARLEVLKPEDLKIVRFLGAGGYGEVYLCRWSNADVAVKCLNPNLMGPQGMSAEAVSDLMKEAMVLGRLRHPNVVWVYGVVLPAYIDTVRGALEGLGDDHQIDVVSVSADAASHAAFMPGMVRAPALVTEFMSGGSVRGALSQHAKFLQSPATRVKLALDTARGMEYLHNKKIVHFDLKAANLLLGWREGTLLCKVADFGLSKQRLQTYVTGVASLRGTLPWTAPEVIRSPQAVNEKVDVFSFGITLWEMWTGKEPWDGLNYHALLHHLTQNPGVRPALPGTAEWEGEPIPEPAKGWACMIQACWNEVPACRPSFTDLVQQLKAMLRQLSGAN